MLITGRKRSGLLIASLVIFLVLFPSLYNKKPVPASWQLNRWIQKVITRKSGTHHSATPGSAQPSPLLESSSSDVTDGHREVFSLTTVNRAYFLIQFGTQQAINPNVIPHPILADTWIIVAQQRKSSVQDTGWYAELVCNAVFQNDTLMCTEPPMLLPLAPTSGDKCEGELDYFALNIGPHDARVFYGPKAPYVLYGSNSMFTCFGQWMQDLRVLIDWGVEMLAEERFRHAIELQRPPPYRPIEKNWFIFWDKHEQQYVHCDIAPNRVIARLNNDGSVGQNLAPLAAYADGKCMARYMPMVTPELESIHQATNSLSITLCIRSDSFCDTNDTNTFIMTIFQRKRFYAFHSTYEPYVMLFRREPPFDIHAISQKAIWIRGRHRVNSGQVSNSVDGGSRYEKETEMFYVTSMNWKTQGQKYHGYLDDVLLLTFGIEDKNSAGIDVLASDLLQDLGLCSDS